MLLVDMYFKIRSEDLSRLKQVFLPNRGFAGLPRLNEILIRYVQSLIKLEERGRERERGLMEVWAKLPSESSQGLAVSNAIRVGVPAEFNTVLHDCP